jgi:hypothetical protein
MISCQLCGKFLKAITNSHLKKHCLTTSEYIHRYGTQLVSDETRQARRKQDFDWQLIDLGQRPDAVVARELGVRREAVGKARRGLSIPAFTGIILTQEGIPCRSIYEAMYDAYLHSKQVTHEHEVPIPTLPYIADFRTDEVYIEIVGMTGFEKYAQKQQSKLRACAAAGIQIEWLNPAQVEELYRNCGIPLQFRVQRRCSDCDAETHDLVRGVCRKCYIRRWHSIQRVVGVCKHCGHKFTHDGSSKRGFCSQFCYHRSMELAWPSWDWIDEQLKTCQHASSHIVLVSSRTLSTCASTEEGSAS